MHYKDQENLPGDSISKPLPAPNGRTTWQSPDHKPDSDLTRSAVRNTAEGWYIVTSAPKSRTATYREGPFSSMHEVETRLEVITAEAQGLRDDPDLNNKMLDRLHSICREAWTRRLFNACRVWVTAVDIARETRAGNGAFVPGTAQYDPVLTGEYEDGHEPTLVETRPAVMGTEVNEIANLRRAWAES